MTSHHTYLKLKTLERNGERWLTGVATTPSIDLQGDSVRPEGAVYDLPMPLLAFHSHSDPVGAVVEAHVSNAGIRVRARLSQGVQKAEELWTLCRDGALSAFSIGFIGLKSTPLATGGVRWDSWRWAECSIVSVPANPDCRFQIGKTAAYATSRQPVQTIAPPVYVPHRDVVKDFESAARCLPGLTASPTRSYKLGNVWQMHDADGALLAAVAPTPDPKPVPAAKGQRLDTRQAELLQAVAEGVLKFANHTKSVIARLEGRITELETTTSMSYAGEFQGAYSYQRGAVTRSAGNLYVALRDIQPGKSPPQRQGSGWERLTT